MSNKIELYTKPFCAYCKRAKELLQIKGVDFVEYDITVEQDRAVEIQRQNQRKSFPWIFINDTLIGGCKELFDLDERGTLDSLLGLVVTPDSHYQ